MMRLVTLAARQWTICAECDDRDVVPVVEGLAKFKAGKTKAAVAGLQVLMDRCAVDGPMKMPAVLTHECGRGIWEFIKGDLRLLYFKSDNRVVVCSHTILKKSQKTPNRDVDAAIRLRDRYERAVRAGDLSWVTGGVDVLQKIR